MNQQRISAGGNLTIDLSDNHWRLLVNGSGVERVLVEAEPLQPIRYAATFGAQRRLPAANTLPSDVIEQIVVGWSVRDESWHLGVVVTAPLSEERGSRWVELAHWPDPSTTQHRDDAILAGERLAANVARPFSIAEPKAISSAPASLLRATPLNMPAPPLLALPIKFDQWTLNQIAPAQLELRLAGAWGRRRLLRTLWYVILASAFALLSIRSITSGIAPPRVSGIDITTATGQSILTIPAPPDNTLVVIGIVCAVLLLLLALINFFSTLGAVKHVVIDGELREVRGLRNTNARRAAWSIPASAIEATYATVLVSAINLGRRPADRKPHYGELSLLKKDGAFKFLAALNQFDHKIAVTDLSDNSDIVNDLTAHDAPTYVHAAALHIARVLDVPARVDQRTR